MTTADTPAEITARCARREIAFAAWRAAWPIYAGVVNDLRTRGVSAGANRMSGADRQRIVDAVQRGVDSLPRVPVPWAWETTATLRDPDGVEREVGVRTVLDRTTGRVTHELLS